jgi:integral membrane protein (TIGR01906 family)
VALAATPSTPASRLAPLVVSLATAFVILGVSIMPFLTPQWIHGEQDRAGASVPGYSGADVQDATDETVRQLLFGADFTFMIHGANFFDDREVSHMDDVRHVFGDLAAVIGGSVVVLVVAAAASRRRPQWRVQAWRAVGHGARWLAVAMVAIGVLSIVAFDQAFEVFHELLFPAGSFSFDPATEHLVQLFPDQFWSDTALVLGIFAVALSLAVAWISRRRGARLAARLASGMGAPASTPALTPRSAT